MMFEFHLVALVSGTAIVRTVYPDPGCKRCLLALMTLLECGHVVNILYTVYGVVILP